jgi:replicative DNA helicase
MSLPQSVEAERSLLGGLMVDPVQLAEVARKVAPPDFYRPEHQKLFELLLTMQAAGRGIDLVTVAAEVMKGTGADRFGGAGYVAELPEHCPSTANLPHYAALVLEASLHRRILTVLDTMKDRVTEGLTEPAEVVHEAVARLTEGGLRDGAERTTWTAVETHAEWVERRRQEAAGTAVARYVPTGFVELDVCLTGGGLAGGQLVLVGGRPGMGKTGFALACAVDMALAGHVVLFVTLEQSHEEMWARAMSTLTGVGTGDLDVTDPTDPGIADASRRLGSLVFLDVAKAGVREVDHEAARVRARFGKLHAIFIDYVQLMKHDQRHGETPATYIGRTSTGLKQLARKLGTPVVLLSQLNREVEKREGARVKDASTWWESVPLPRPSDLLASGQLEADADVILFPVSGAGYQLEDRQLGAVVVAKQRNGPTGVFPLAWDAGSATYRNWEAL